MIKKRVIDDKIERDILTGMIVSEPFLRELSTFYDPKLVAAPYVRRVAHWCLQYWRRYQQPPGRHIQDVFESEARAGAMPPEQEQSIRDFLEDLSREYESKEEFNIDYLLDAAEARFQERSLLNLSQDVRVLSEQGEPEEAMKVLAAYRKPSRVMGDAIDPFANSEAIKSAIDDYAKDVLLQPPGELGRFTGPLTRSDLLMILAPEKRGKTFWLWEIGMWGTRRRLNVAFFGVKDMTREQYLRRAHARNTETTIKKPGPKLVPVFDCAANQEDSCTKPQRTCRTGLLIGSGEKLMKPDVNIYNPDEWAGFHSATSTGYVACDACRKDEPRSYRGEHWYVVKNVEKLTSARAIEEAASVVRRMKGSRFKLCVLSSASVEDLRTQLIIWEHQEGFVPDVIVVDDADNLEAPRAESFRHGEYAKWGELRTLAMDYHAAVVTASKSDAASYTTHTMKETNFSEDKRKFGLVSAGVWTLNQSDREKRQGILRLGRMFVREDDFSTLHTVHVMECRAIGRPYLGSYFK